MDEAHCWLKDHEGPWVASAFAVAPGVQQEQLRRFLQCIGCKAPAAFRRASRHGHDPCFSAHHAPGCGYASQSQSARAIAFAHEVNRIETDVSVLKLDLTIQEPSPQPEAPPATVDASGDGEQRVRRQHTGPASGVPRISKVGGQRLLHYLIHSPSFRQSPLKIDLGKELGVYEAAKLFRPFEDAVATGQAKRGIWHGYWGQLAYASADMVWLNPSNCDNLGITIEDGVRDDEYRRWGITDRESIAGSYALVFGIPRLRRDGKVNLVVTLPGRILLWPEVCDG